MPSSGAFARVGLGAAVAVVIGISTFGPLLKQVTPTQGATGLVAGVAPVPSDSPPPLSGRALNDAVAGVMSSSVRASSTNPTEVPAGAAPRAEPPTTGIAAPSAPVASATSTSAFPPMQTMTDEGSARAEQAQPTSPAATASSRPRGAEKSSAKRVADAHAGKKKRPEHPKPFGIREFLAGRW